MVGPGLLTMALGASALADGLGSLAGLEPLAMAGLYVYLVLAPLWALTLGVSLLRRPALAPPGA